MIEKIRKVLETHKIAPVSAPYATDSSWVPPKCAGCPWIGWDHVDHLAAMIEKAIK